MSSVSRIHRGYGSGYTGPLKAAVGVSLYVSSDGQTIGTWSGLPVLRVLHATVTRTRLGKVYFWLAQDRDGQKWYGRNGGESMLITMRPKKR